MACGAKQVDLGVSGGVGKQELVLRMLVGLGLGAWGLGAGFWERRTALAAGAVCWQ